MGIVFEDEFKYNNNNEKFCMKESNSKIEIDMSHDESAISLLPSSTIDLSNDENTAPTKITNNT